MEYQRTNRLADLMVAKGLLESLEAYYPDFSHWYVNRCMPGVLVGTDLMFVAKDKQHLVGLALAKRTKDEVKLRCVRVLPEYQDRGVGLHLIDKTLRALNEDKPHCTVAEEMLHLYSRAFVNRYHFNLSDVDKGLYRKGKLEYVFNKPAITPAVLPL